MTKKNKPLATMITEKQFRSKVLESDKPALVVFVADWSGSCHLVDPILERLDDDIKENNNIFKIESEKNLNIVEKYNISNFPTFLFIDNGDIIDSISGLTSHTELSEKLITIRHKVKTAD